MSALAYIQGNWCMMKWYFSTLPLLWKLPSELNRPDFAPRFVDNKSFSFRVPTKHATTYNNAINKLKGSIRALHSGQRQSFQVIMFGVFAARVLSIILAVMGYKWLALASTALQLVWAPYSGFVSITMFAALFPPMFSGYFLTYLPMQALLRAIPLPVWLEPYTYLEFNNWVVVGYMVFDYGMCTAAYWGLGDIRPVKAVPRERLMQSLLYGSFNCKSYFLVLLLVVRGCRVDLLVWLVDAVLCVSDRVCHLVEKWCYNWTMLFYQQHRMGHLPVVYLHAHKFHHYLHDSTPFDAHAYGSGLPEEWHMLMVDALPALLCGIPPASLSWNIIKVTWSSRRDHTRKEENDLGVNRHCDHHLYHTKNYGITCAALDMFMGTAVDNDRMQFRQFTILRSEEGEDTVFNFKLTKELKEE